MAYADYAYYTGTYKGNVVPSSEFDRAMARASSYIDLITGGQASSTSYTNEVKLAACAVADVIFSSEGTQGKSSESGIGYSVSYDTKEKNALKFKAVKEYLWPTGLLYSGVV